MRMCPHRIGQEIEFNDSTDPNTLWASTTWTQITDGRVTLASSSAHALNSTGGAETKSYTPVGTVGGHTLTVNEMPRHTHNLEFYGGWSSDNNRRSGSFMSHDSYAYSGSVVSSNIMGGGEWVHYAGGGASHNHGFTGTAATINVMQPWRAVNRWRRVA